MHKPIIAPATVATLLSATAVHSQSYMLDEILVTPNRFETELAMTGASVSIVDAETIEADGRPFAVDYITELPGITVNQAGPAGSVSGFSVRGAPQQYTRVYIDGIEVSDPSKPPAYASLSGLLVDDVERIEVLKGSQSAIYGGQAVGGVIDITSPRASREGLSTNFRLEGGSYGTFRGALGLAGLGERGEFAVNLARYQTDGFSAAEGRDGNSEDDGYRTTRASATGTFALTDTLSVFGSAFWQKEDGDADSGPGVGGDGPDTFDRNEWGARAGIDFQTFGSVQNTIAASYYDIDRIEVSVFGPFEATGTRSRVEYIGRYQAAPEVDIQFGADYTRETSESNYSDGTFDNSVAGIFGEAIWAPFDALTIDGSIRYDSDSEYGGHTTGRLNAAYVLPSETILKASVGTGFRPPSHDELFTSYGNSELEPETSTSADVGIEQVLAGGRGRLNATLFWLEINDLIQYSTDTFTYVQTEGKSESKGVELSGAWNISDNLAVTGAYTYTDAQNPDGTRRDRIPSHNLTLSLDGSFREKFQYHVGARFVADYVDTTGVESRSFTEDYVVFNAKVAYAVSDNAELYVRAENLFDEQYQTARGYGTSDRAIYLGLTGRF